MSLKNFKDNKKLISKIVIGSAQFGMNYGVSNQGGKLKKKEIIKIFQYCKKKKINHLDLATKYQVSLDLLRKIDLKGWKINFKISKFGSFSEKKENKYINEVKSNIKSLNLRSLDTIMIHDPEDLRGVRGVKIFNFLKKLKHKNLTKNVGVSIDTLEQLKFIISNYKIDVVQFSFNVFNQMLKKSGWMKKLKKKNISLHVRSIFLQGLLLLNKDQLPKKFIRWKKNWILWDNFLKKNKISHLEGCLRFVLQEKEIKKIIVGIDELNHLKEIVSKMKNYKKINFSKFHSTDKNLICPFLW